MDFSPERWGKVRENYGAWWTGELDRPLISLQVGGRTPEMESPGIDFKHFTSNYPDDLAPEKIVDGWQYSLEGRYYLGDAFPGVWPNFGPGVLAAFIGCELHKAEDTAWFHPREVKSLEELTFEFDPDAFWFRRICDIACTAVERFQGLVQIGNADWGGNLDILSSFRPSELLLMDLYDCPDEVKRLTWEAHEVWWQCYTAYAEKLGDLNPGYTAWSEIFSEDPYYMLQCDFCYMISPDMFDEFVKPELAAMCKKLVNPFYHLDGPGQLDKLDSLLEIPELKGVQWIPGAGQPDVEHWPDVYRKIRDAGKLIQVFTGQSEKGFRLLDDLADQLGSAEGILLIGGAQPDEIDEAREFLKKYGAE